MMKQYQLSLLALACGDAYGAAFEFMSKSSIPDNLPDKSIGGGPFNFKPGEVTDDTDMTIITLEHIKKYNSTQPELLKANYKNWAETAKDVGAQISNALLYDRYDQQGQGNGALMKIIPVVVFMKDEMKYPLDKTKAEIKIISSITHINERIHLINNMFIDKIYGSFDEFNYLEILEEINLTTSSTGWVLNTVRIVNNIYTQNLSFLDGFKECVRYGGDTDTTCAIYGGYLGCFKDIRKELDILKFINQNVYDLIQNI